MNKKSRVLNHHKRLKLLSASHCLHNIEFIRTSNASMSIANNNKPEFTNLLEKKNYVHDIKNNAIIKIVLLIFNSILNSLILLLRS